jgi:hypothetical protein
VSKFVIGGKFVPRPRKISLGDKASWGKKPWGKEGLGGRKVMEEEGHGGRKPSEIIA